jgi:hypothetical protein
MRTFLATVATLTLATAGGMMLWRAADHRADRAEMNRLLTFQPVAPAPFDPAMVADLPEPARRFLIFAIAPGTPLRTVAQIEMRGRFSLGSKEAPNYMKMRARQTLAAPHGFVWVMEGGDGHLRLSGSDSASWTRFWMGGILPVARIGGDEDHRRSAFGRYVAEAVFWTPAALMPGPGVTWEAAGEDVARVVVSYEGLSQSVDIRVDAEGRPIEVAFPRWSDANPERVHRIQPFGGYLSEFRKVDGFRLPTHVEAGNMFGTEDYFPFFVADVTAIRFPSARALRSLPRD